jgi:hypothetical protein
VPEVAVQLDELGERERRLVEEHLAHHRAEYERAIVDTTLYGNEEAHRRWTFAPDLQQLTFGAGMAQEQSILGNPQHPFYGVTVLNRTAKTLYMNFGTSGAWKSPLIISPYSGLTWPARYVDLSFAVESGEATGTRATVNVLRLQEPPGAPSTFGYGGPSELATSVYAGSISTFTVGLASALVVGENTERRGLELQQQTTGAKVYLGLGKAAVAGSGLMLEPGGSWNGTISGLLWRGAVYAIGSAAATLGVVEL